MTRTVLCVLIGSGTHLPAEILAEEAYFILYLPSAIRVGQSDVKDERCRSPKIEAKLGAWE